MLIYGASGCDIILFMPIHPPHKHRNHEWWIVLVIMAVAFVFRFQHIQSTPPGLYPDEAMNGNNALQALETGDYKLYYPENNGREGLFIALQAQSIRIFGNEAWALRVVSAFFGTLTVLGLYLLTRKLFNWEIAAFASFLMAVSFWHTMFSRIGFRAIMAPFFLVWALYFFWKGKTTLHLVHFGLAGVFFGLGFYTYISYRIVPLIVIATLLAYWYFIKKDFAHDKYIHARNELTRGLAMFMLVTFIVALPLGWYYFTHPADFLGRTSQVSIFSADHPTEALIVNTGKTLGMFNFAGDYNWRHNFSGRPLLFWPVGIMFLIGFLRSWRKFTTIHVMLLSWFILGLAPVILSSEGLPHALRAILVVPVVFIFAGEGLWWVYNFTRRWYRLTDKHEVVAHGHHTHESNAIATLAVVLLLVGIMLNEYRVYFKDWAHNPNLPDAFDVTSVELGRKLNALPQSQLKYVLVNAGGVLVNNIPMPAQTVMYITDTWTPEKQQAKNIFYLTEEQYAKKLYPKNATIFPLH